MIKNPKIVICTQNTGDDKSLYDLIFVILNTKTFKIKHIYAIDKFSTAYRLCTIFFFEKTLKEVCSPHLYASFGTF